MMLASAWVPWSTSESINDAQLHPFATDAMRPSAIVVLLVVTVGLAAWLMKGTTASVAGLGGLMWLSCALLIWYFGIRLQLLLPGSIVPDGAVMSLEPGIYLAIAGSSLVLLVAFADALARFTPVNLGESMIPIRSVVGLGVIVGLISSYGAPWFRIDILERDWRVGLDAVPIAGDFFGPFLVVTAACVAWWAISPGRVISCLLVAIGVVLTIGATVAGLSSEAAEQGVRTTMTRIGALQSGTEIAAAGVGPWLMAGCGLGLVALGATSLLRAGRVTGPAVLLPIDIAASSTIRVDDELPY